MLGVFLRKLWGAYEKRYTLYTGIATGIFLLQIVHLYWLTTNVVLFRLLGIEFSGLDGFWQLVIVVIDYLEIPAIIGTSIIYLSSLNKKWNIKDVVLLLFLNSQWLHIFWISDEYVVNVIRQQATATILPFWLAWAAIAIDYLELPVMFDTTKKFIASFFPMKAQWRFQKGRMG